MVSVEAFLKKHSLSAGDSVEVESETGRLKGTVLPSSGKFLELKLGSGYNVGIEPEKIKSAKKTGLEKNVGKAAKSEIRQDLSLPLISVVHTGGTLASRVDYKTGGVKAGFDAEDILSLYPELLSTARIDAVFAENIMSEDMSFSHYPKIVQAIRKEIEKGSQGVIVTHGTDTLHYTAAALSFIFEELPVPVLLVGSQRSSDRPSSDAGMNLVCAAKFMIKTDFSGVAICMHSSTSDSACSILPGTKTRKIHTSRRDAFKAINAVPIAEIDANSGEIIFNSKDYAKKNNSKKCVIAEKFEPKVAILKARPNLQPEEIDFYRKAGFKGLVLETTGIGHMPMNTEENAGNKKALKSLIESGCIVCATSQCIYGRVHESIYTNSRALHALGVIFLEDMTTETALVKLAWLLGNYPKKAAELMPKNLRGEIAERRSEEEFSGGQ
ncbi:MAG: Glu-tRNA(Gln) amidotransferase subunit GatD [Candidatus Diapherotrites archaeon]|nr:Glu-tRNA(Gln) amidotransferase subunit GatD [Candidatus Diapherotrites archaeon]